MYVRPEKGAPVNQQYEQLLKQTYLIFCKTNSHFPSK